MTTVIPAAAYNPPGVQPSSAYPQHQVNAPAPVSPPYPQYQANPPPPPVATSYPQYQANNPPPPMPTSYPQQHVVPVVTNGGRCERYKKQVGLTTGVLQICGGAVLCALGIMVVALGTDIPIGWSIWGSLCFYIVTGILGVASRNQNRCVIIAYMVMCIMSALCAAGQAIMDSISAIIVKSNYGYDCDYHYDSYGKLCENVDGIVALHALIAVGGLAEMVIAIVASAYCCHGVCCTSTPTQTILVTTQQAPNFQVHPQPAYAGGYTAQQPNLAGQEKTTALTTNPSAPPSHGPPPAYDDIQ